MDDDVYRLIEVLNDRLTDLSKAYRVLNENHKELEVGFAELRSKVDTAVAIVKWVGILSPISLILLMLRLYELMR